MLAAALLSLVAVSQAQTSGGEERETPKHRFQRDEHLIAQWLKNPDEAPESIRERVLALRRSQAAVRNAWIESYRPGDDATADEIRVAREAFQKEYAEEIRASRELRSALIRDLRSGVRGAIEDAVWGDQARAIYAEYTQSQAALGAAWKEARAALGQNPTREELKAAREQFNRANADVIAKQKRLAKQVRDLMREGRDERMASRDELPLELDDLRSDMASLRDRVRARQRQAREEMQNLSAEEREAYRQALLEELRQLHDEIKQRRRQVIEDMRAGQPEPRRSRN